MLERQQPEETFCFSYTLILVCLMRLSLPSNEPLPRQKLWVELFRSASTAISGPTGWWPLPPICVHARALYLQEIRHILFALPAFERSTATPISLYWKTWKSLGSY